MSTEVIENGQEGTDNITPEIRNKALAGGWSDKEHWKGDPNAWVDADVFVKRGDEWLGNVRKQNEVLARDLQSTKEQLKELRSATEDFKKFQKEAYDRKVVELEAKMTTIKAQRAQAISDGDGAKVNDLDDALDNAKEEVKEAKAASVEQLKPTPELSPNIAPELQSWLESNSWFGQDKRLTGIANGIGESLRLEFPLLKGQAFLDKLDQVLEEEMPTKFGKRTRSGPAVESGSGRSGRGNVNAKSYDNLPAEAKTACDRYVKQKLMTREQYVSDYSWE
jgi:hypothetical protein